MLDLVRKEIKQMPTEEYAPKEEQLNVKSNMALNINPFRVSEKVLQKLRVLSELKVHHYYPENSDFLRLISEYVGVNKENVLIGDGCDGCIEMIAHTFIAAEDKAIIPVPTFHRYEFHTKMMGGSPVFIEMKNFKLSADDILRQSKDAKIIFLCNPNNPTGLELEKQELSKLINNFKGIIVIDEALADATDVNGMALTKKYNNLIIVRSFSKTFGLASCRVGYAVASKEIIDQVKKVSSPFKVNGIGQELAIAALQDKEHISKSREFLETERNYLFKELDKLGLFHTKSITTNFLVDLERISSNSGKAAKILEQKGVLVTDASVFKVPKNSYVRIAVNTREENEVFVNVLAELINKKQ